VPRDLPLHDEVGPNESTIDRIQQSPEYRGGVRERRVGDHPERTHRQRHIVDVGAQHRDIPRVRDPPRQPAREVAVELDGQDRRAGRGERGRQRAGTRAEVDDAVRGRDTGVSDEMFGEPFASEEVLAETLRPRGRVPGHG